MEAKTFVYIAQRFSPREGSDRPLLLFVAPAADIRTWAGVPRKAFDYQHGFQRTLNPSRVSDVAQYYMEDKRNLSPTSVVVGLTGDISIVPLGMDALASEGAAHCEAVKVSIVVPDFEAIPIGDLIERGMATLKSRLPQSTVSEIHANKDTAISLALQLQEEDAIDETFGIQSNGSVEEDLPVTERSYLADFYAQLLGYSLGLIPVPDEAPLREVLYSLLKPAIIVDGQHRIFGAATVDQKMLLAVCAIPEATWAESVYQFVVINQKAKPIKPAFLSSIIATSLSDDDVKTVYTRLQTSRIDVDRSQLMHHVDIDPESPFRGMVDFEVERSLGYLQFPGMTKLVRTFQNIPNSHAGLLPTGVWEGVEGAWIDHFFALWRGVRSYFETRDPRLWTRPSKDNPNNLLKIVTLQEMQGLMLDNWADSRVFRLKEVAATESHARDFWEDFPPTFFSDEWQQKGLQTSVGRSLLRDAIVETRRNIGRKGWGHRRLKLFSR